MVKPTVARDQMTQADEWREEAEVRELRVINTVLKQEPSTAVVLLSSVHLQEQNIY